MVGLQKRRLGFGGRMRCLPLPDGTLKKKEFKLTQCARRGQIEDFGFQRQAPANRLSLSKTRRYSVAWEGGLRTRKGEI